MSEPTLFDPAAALALLTDKQRAGVARRALESAVNRWATERADELIRPLAEQAVAEAVKDVIRHGWGHTFSRKKIEDIVAEEALGKAKEAVRAMRVHVRFEEAEG